MSFVQLINSKQEIRNKRKFDDTLDDFAFNFSSKRPKTDEEEKWEALMKVTLAGSMMLKEEEVQKKSDRRRSMRLTKVPRPQPKHEKPEDEIAEKRKNRRKSTSALEKKAKIEVAQPKPMEPLKEEQEEVKVPAPRKTRKPAKKPPSIVSNQNEPEVSQTATGQRFLDFLFVPQKSNPNQLFMPSPRKIRKVFAIRYLTNGNCEFLS